MVGCLSYAYLLPIVLFKMVFDEKEVVARAQEGDPAAFSELVRRYRQRVYLTALHVVGSHSEAEDIAQDAFIRAYRALPSFDGRSQLFTWLYRITVNTALNHLRSAGRRQKLAHAGTRQVAQVGGRPEAPGKSAPDPLRAVLLTERTQRVFAALDELSDNLRVTLVLATVDELTYKQIAKILEIPEGTVAWRVSEARKKLRERLDGEHGASRKKSDEQAI